MTRLSEIRARLEKATPGEWYYFQDTHDSQARCKLPKDHPLYAEFNYPGSGEGDCGIAIMGGDWDNRVIAHAPSDLRHLLGLVEEMRGALERIARKLICETGTRQSIAREALSKLEARDGKN